MEKNKNRTDLLAAGRKRLQQFRKKKETKGKSFNKSSKSEHDDGDPEAGAPLLSSEVAEEESSAAHNADAVNLLEKTPEAGTDFAATSETGIVDIVSTTAGDTGREEAVSVGDLSIPVVVQNAGSESIVATEVAGDMETSVVAPMESSYKAELSSVDSLLSVTGVNRDEDIPSFPSEELATDVTSAREKEDVEADRLESNQCGISGEGGNGLIQSGKSLKRDDVSEHIESSESLDNASRDGEGTDEAPRNVGAVDANDFSASNDMVDETREVVDVSVSVSGEAIDEAKGIPDMIPEKHTEIGTMKSEGNNKTDGTSFCSGENHEVGIDVSAETTGGREGIDEVVDVSVSDHVTDNVGAPDMISEKGSEVRTVKRVGTNEVDGVYVHPEGSHEFIVSAPVDTPNGEEQTHELVGVSEEAIDEAEGYPDSMYEKGNEVATGSTDRTNEVDGVSSHPDGSDEVGVSAFAETNKEKGTLCMDAEEVKEEMNHTALGTNESNDVSVSAQPRHVEEGTYDSDVSSISAHASPEPVRIFDTNLSEEADDVRGQLFADASMFLSHDLAIESQQGFQAHVEQSNSVEEAVAIAIPTQKVLHEAKTEEFNEAKTLSPFTNMGSVDFNVLENMVRGLDEGQFRLLVKSRSAVSEAESGEVGNLTMLENEFVDNLESLKQQLYFSNVTKYFLHFQLAEQIELYTESDERNSQLQNQVLKLQYLLEQTQGSNTSLSEELAQCRSEIGAMVAGREELEIQLLSASGEIEQITPRSFDMQTQLERTQEEIRNLSVELADCRDLLEALETEKANLNGSLIAVTDVREKLEEEKSVLVHENEILSAQIFEYKATQEEIRNLSAELSDCRDLLEALETEKANLSGSLIAVTDDRKKLEEEKAVVVHENGILSAQLFEYKENLAVENDKYIQLGVDLKDAMMRLEQLTEENIFLSNSLDVYKSKVKETDSGHLQTFSHNMEAKFEVEGLAVPVMAHENPIDPVFSQQGAETYVGKGGFATEGAVTLGQSEGSSFGPLAGDRLDDSSGFLAFKVSLEEAQETIQKLEKAIEGMNSYSVLLSKSSAKAPGAGVSKLIQAFELKVHHDDNDPVETTSPVGERTTDDCFKLATEQTSILRAVLKELELGAEKLSQVYKEEQEGRKLASVALGEVQILYEGSKEQISDLEAKHIDFSNKLSEYQSRTDHLNSQLCTMQQSSDEMSSLFVNQVETLQKEVGEKTSILEHEWDSTIQAISVTVEKLEASTRRLLTANAGAQSDELDVSHRIAASVDVASKLIEELHQKLEASYTGYQASLKFLESLSEKFCDLHVRHGVSAALLQMIYIELRKFISGSCDDVGESEMELEDEQLFDLLQPISYINLMDQLGELLSERLQLKSAKKELESNLTSRIHEVEDLKDRFVDSKFVMKLVEDVKSLVKLDEIEITFDTPPVSQLEYLINFLLQKYREANEQVGLSREQFGLKLTEINELKGEMHHLSSLNCQKEDEIHILKGKLTEMEGNLEALRAEIEVKGTEHEQSEQRINSIREKLSIAVAKGKGLIVQRDNLKQSLSDVSTELERCSMELQYKDTKLHEVETKLKTYSEAGERIEDLESELSYIRNSATTLRESFLLKDSVIQRIEEILEDLELPEHFHSRHIVEKIEWLAKSVAGNSMQMTDWDQKSSVEGGSYSDGGFVVMDGWKDDVQSSLDHGLDDLKRKYEELQGKFYGLAEQNEMLEQSLMERNNLIRRWEVVLDRIDMPLQLRSMEPEERIGWLGNALYEAHHDKESLHQKIENLESYCRSLTDDLEVSQRKTSELEVTLQAVRHERDFLSESLENLTHEHEKVSETCIQGELQNDGLRNELTRLQNELTSLQEKLTEKLENEDYLHQVGGEIKRLHVLVSDVLQDQSVESVVSSDSDTECLERSLRKLIENYIALSSGKTVGKGTAEEHLAESDTVLIKQINDESVGEDTVEEHHAEESDVVLVKQIDDDVVKSMEQDRVVLKEELEETLHSMALLKTERDGLLEKHQLLVVEFEALVRQRDDLQDKLSQEDQKLTSTRDKLNVAVRKGKALVQQRDGLKQAIEEMNKQVEYLKNELNQRESAIVQYEQKIKDLSIYPEKVETLEHERLFTRNRLTEMEHNLQAREHSLSGLLNILSSIDLGNELNSLDPINKMEEVSRVYRDVQTSLASSEHEVRKSKRATELLLAELNEVHERADGLQDELSKAEATFARLSKERDAAEATKNEAISRLEKVITAQTEERKITLAELIKLRAGVDQLRKSCFEFATLLPAVFSSNKEVLHNMEAGLASLLGLPGSTNVINLPLLGAPGDMFLSKDEVKFPSFGTLLKMKNQENFDDTSSIDVLGVVGHSLQECAREIDFLTEICHKHSISFHDQAKNMSKVTEAVSREMDSQKKYLESMKSESANLDLIRKENDAEVFMLRRHLALLFEACSSSIFEIENLKVQLSGNGSDFGVHALRKISDGKYPVDEPASLTEEDIRTLADTLLLAVKGSAKIQAEIVDGSQKELKATILNLQKELQEKDIQRTRICGELVSQIQEAEASVKNYLVDLESSKAQVKYLENRIEILEKERNGLELRIEKLQDGEALSVQLQGRIASLTESLNAKGQENEDLMQALDEEESQIEGLTNRIKELEKILQEKNLALENLEASRGKAMAKLSTTVHRFDELHKLSQNLISEVENLQSQLQSRDVEISFLRQEVTRCTNDVLTASQVSNKRNSTEMNDLLTWFGMMTARFGGQDVHLDDPACNRVEAYKEILEKQILSLVSELEDLRNMTQSKDDLLQVERSRVQELTRKAGTLEHSLSQKEVRIASLQNAQDLGEATSMNPSEITEIEPLISKRSVSGASVAPHIRSVRKLNNDQVAIGIDMDPGVSTLDEDDDKVHGFKSLTSSRIVPRFTRPVSDIIDGLWVSCDRALMRQPALRLGIILYWFVLHTLLATSMV